MIPILFWYFVFTIFSPSSSPLQESKTENLTYFVISQMEQVKHLKIVQKNTTRDYIY